MVSGMDVGNAAEDGTLLLGDRSRRPRHVPPAMGRYQAAQIPRCHSTLLPGEGHLLIIDRMPDLTSALRPAAPPR